MLKFVNYEKIVTDLKSSADNLVNDLKILQRKFTDELEVNYQSENLLLREQLNYLEKRFNSEHNFVKRFEESLRNEKVSLDDTLDFVSFTIITLYIGL